MSDEKMTGSLDHMLVAAAATRDSKMSGDAVTGEMEEGLRRWIADTLISLDRGMRVRGVLCMVVLTSDKGAEGVEVRVKNQSAGNAGVVPHMLRAQVGQTIDSIEASGVCTCAKCQLIDVIELTEILAESGARISEHEVQRAAGVVPGKPTEH